MKGKPMPQLEPDEDVIAVSALPGAVIDKCIREAFMLSLEKDVIYTVRHNGRIYVVDARKAVYEVLDQHRSKSQ